MAELAVIASVATLGAAVIGAGASVYAGNEAKKTAYANAKLLEAEGREEFAAAQREAQERRLEGELILSRQQAAAAASGGGAGMNDPTIVRLMTETGERIAYGVESSLYAGRSRRQSYYAAADAKRRSGDASFLGGIFTGIGSLAGGIGDSASVYNSFG